MSETATQPGMSGFTWDDVDLLNLTIDRHAESLAARGVVDDSAYGRTQRRWRDLRDRIAALLPPRVET